MATRLYTRTQDLDLFERCYVSFDITQLDFRSSPPLQYYVRHWFDDLDDLIEHLHDLPNKKVTLIISDLKLDVIYEDLHFLFPQIDEICIVGKHGRQFKYVIENIKVTYFDEVQSLVNNLTIDIRSRQRLYITFDTWPTERTSHDLNKCINKFLWFSYFYTILSRLKNTAVARMELLESIENFHTKQTDLVKQSCKEFEQTYRSSDIIKWYTRASFLYLLLNRTLRSENINHIFAMRYVIFDLENFIRDKRPESSSIDVVFRGQQIHLSEIQELEENIGGLFGLTAFWSTTRSKTIALHFAEIWPVDRMDPVECVLFTIRIPSDIQRAVYLDISKISDIESEIEVLFSFRSIFRIEHVARNGNTQIWYVELTLVDEANDQFLSILDPWYSSTNGILTRRSFFTSQPRHPFSHDLTHDNGPFLASQLLIDMILRLDQNSFARQEFIEVCREYCQNKPIDLVTLEEFDRTYELQDAVSWYTTDCFLYRLLNKALLEENIDVIFKLRYYIHDLHNQLAQMQVGYFDSLLPSQQILTLYRGLKMKIYEFHELEQNQGNLVSTNSFLSTTSDYEAALAFAGDGDGSVAEDSVSVVYIIQVDRTIKHLLPFAKIEEYVGKFNDENEILFSMGAVFRIEELEQLKDRLWTVNLILTPTDEKKWNDLTAHLNSR